MKWKWKCIRNKKYLILKTFIRTHSGQISPVLFMDGFTTIWLTLVHCRSIFGILPRDPPKSAFRSWFLVDNYINRKHSGSTTSLKRNNSSNLEITHTQFINRMCNSIYPYYASSSGYWVFSRNVLASKIQQFSINFSFQAHSCGV